MSFQQGQVIHKRLVLRVLAVLLLLGMGAMEYAHLDYHRKLVRNPDQTEYDHDREHALFHCGPAAEPPPDLIGPLESVPAEVPQRTVALPHCDVSDSVDARAPPRLV